MSETQTTENICSRTPPPQPILKHFLKISVEVYGLTVKDPVSL